MSAFQLSFPDSPAALTSLLDSVRRGKRSAADIPLHEVTERLAMQLRQDREIDLDMVGEVLATTARLMVLKSEALLPVMHEPDEDNEQKAAVPNAVDLQALRCAAQVLSQREGMESYRAEPRPSTGPVKLEPRPAASLRSALDELRTRQPDDALPVAAPSFMRLEVALSRLVRWLKPGARLSLRAILRRAGRNEAVIHFLAVLELVRRRQARARQEELFGEISIEPGDRSDTVSARAG
jgi:segregation and condensation protein A